MIIRTALEQTQLTDNKKKAEVNCSFEDVEVSIWSNEDIRNQSDFSWAWSYCTEQTDRQTTAVLQMCSSETDVPLQSSTLPA